MKHEKRATGAKEISRRQFVQTAGGVGLGAAAVAAGVPAFAASVRVDEPEDILARLQEGVQSLQDVLAILGGTVEVHPDEIIRGGRIDADLFLIPSEDIKLPDGKSKPLDQLDGVVIGVLYTPIALQADQSAIPAGFSVMQVRQNGSDWVADFFGPDFAGFSAPDATLTATLPPQEELPPAAANAPVMPVARSFNGFAAGAIAMIAIGPRAAMFPLKRATGE